MLYPRQAPGGISSDDKDSDEDTSDTAVPNTASRKASTPGKAKTKESSTRAETPSNVPLTGNKSIPRAPDRKSQGSEKSASQTKLPHAASSSVPKARFSGNWTEESTSKTSPLQNYITTLLGKISRPGKADEIANMAAMLSLGAIDITRIPEGLESVISDLVIKRPHKNVNAVVCAITALIIHSSGVTCFPTSPENQPVLHFTLQNLLGLLSRPNDDIFSTVGFLATASSVTEKMAKAMIRESCKDTPEAVDAIGIAAVAMADCWGNSLLLA
jgi:hypothetical protein